MQEAKIIVPDRDNDGHDLSALRNKIAAEMVSDFGGATEVSANGLWRDPTGKVIAEPVTQLVAAADECPATDAALRGMADEINRISRQAATYVRYPNGHVEIISAAKGANRDAA